eukprot:COSAG06_NODE_83_length_25105_cov_69.740913_21_plen_144_part_00
MCATIFIEFMVSIKERYGRWPVAKTFMRVDNGQEYGKTFEAACKRGIEVVFPDEEDRFELKVVRGGSNVANGQRASGRLTTSYWGHRSVGRGSSPRAPAPGRAGRCPSPTRAAASPHDPANETIQGQYSMFMDLLSSLSWPEE